jgi:N-acetylglucosamine-6-phosphate deacetylase
MRTVAISGLDPQSGHSITVRVDDGFITHMEETGADMESYLSAGLVDLQVNGVAGYDFNEEQISIDTVSSVTAAMLASGVTCFAPTLITAPEEALCRRLKVIAEARGSNRRVAGCIPFVHVEGPHISPLEGFRGAHPAEFVRPPSIAEFNRWQESASGLVGMVTLSPHYNESADYIAELTRRGVHVAIGHTHATPEQIKQAVDGGASLSTHLGNGIAQEIPRHRNPIWSQLADDRLSAALIADGHHLPDDVLKVMLRVKGVDRSVLVSDSVALAGMPAGVYTTPVGGRVELHPDGRLCVLNSELLAGSTTSVAKCINHLVRAIGIPLHDAISMATVNPGRFADGRGQLTIGSRADLVRFRMSGELTIENVWLAGELVH